MKTKTSILHRNRHFLYCFLCTVFLFTSCQKMKYGNVVEKWHEPGSHYMMLMPMTISTGKSTTTMMIPYYIHDNEDWCIKVTGIGVKGDTITRTYYVDKMAFDTLSVGKFICVDGACDDDENNTKVRQ